MATSSDIDPAYGDHDGTFDLRISDPVSLLNEIARRYASTERILMEYVDNPIDDAEELYRANADAYPYEIRVDIIIDHARRTVTIRDNCRGMKLATLARIVENVGESRKRGLTWVNGQFGFGVHAFRAAAHEIRFRTKHAEDEHLELRLRRDQHQGIKRPWPISLPFPTETGTGTEVVIGPFEDDTFRDVTAASVKQEIERHFERLLARPQLTVIVTDSTSDALLCKAFDYAQVCGEDFRRILDLQVGDHTYPVEVFLKVVMVEAPEQTARFFARGRRINDIAGVGSFISKSHYRTAVWGHPHLLGYIEVGEIVRPVITRDGFSPSEGRKTLYNALLALEDDIKAALDRVNEAQRDSSLTHLGDVLSNVLDSLARQDRLRMRSELAAGHETGILVPGGGAETGPTDEVVDVTEVGGPNPRPVSGQSRDERRDTDPVCMSEPEAPGAGSGSSMQGYQVLEDPERAQGTRRARSGFDIQFSNLPPDLNGDLARSKLVDGTIYINTQHPDFKERMAYTRQGRPKFNDRLGAYLAATVSIHYKDQLYARYGRQPDRRDQMFDQQVEFMCRFEAALRPCLPHLQQDFGGYGFEEAGDD